MNHNRSANLLDETTLVDTLADSGNHQGRRAAAIDRIACRLLEAVTGVPQTSTYQTPGELPHGRLEAIERLADGHRNAGGAKRLRAVTLGPQLAGAIAVQLADCAEILDGKGSGNTGRVQLTEEHER